jgi:predicted amidohydrolase YtcJ
MRLIICFSVVAMLCASATAFSADLVVRNALIYTVDDDNPWAEAIAVDEGRISYVGGNSGVEAHVDSNTEIIDARGQLLLPGFIDAHVHPLEGSTTDNIVGCDIYELSITEPSPEKWIPELKSCTDPDSIHGWVLGWGHSGRQLTELDRMPRELLDDAFPNMPAAFMERSSHSMWVNSLALKHLGITADTPNPQGGMIFKDDETGEPNGILSDSAGDELMHKVLARTPALQEARYQAMLASQDMLARNGITSANNARVYWDRGNLEPWLRGEKEGTLKARMVMSLWTYPHMDDEKQLQKLRSMYRNDKHSMLRLSQIKLYSDGVPSLNSAAVLEPYGLLIHPEANPTGGNYFTEERMARYISELERVGFGVIVHAIGDRAVRESLNAIEAAAAKNPELSGNVRRHYVTHVGWVHPQDISRFAELNVPADTQINFESDGFDAEPPNPDGDWQRLYENTKSDINALPEIYETGARIVLSSDWDVSSVNPLVSIENAFASFDEVIPIDEILPFAIKAYTLEAAWALDQEELTGSLEVGKFADFVILDQDIFDLEPREIDQAKVVVTFVGGRRVHPVE